MKYVRHTKDLFCIIYVYLYNIFSLYNNGDKTEENKIVRSLKFAKFKFHLILLPKYYSFHLIWDPDRSFSVNVQLRLIHLLSCSPCFANLSASLYQSDTFYFVDLSTIFLIFSHDFALFSPASVPYLRIRFSFLVSSCTFCFANLSVFSCYLSVFFSSFLRSHFFLYTIPFIWMNFLFSGFICPF